MSRLKIISMTAAIITLSFITTTDRNSPSAEVKWYNFNQGLQLASAQKKPVMIDFYADWCGWCKVMEKKTFNNPAVNSYLRSNFVSVRLDADSQVKSISYIGAEFSPSEFFKLIGSGGLPTVLFMDSNGDFITKLPGYAESNVFLPLLKYVRTGDYKKGITFDQKYINSHQMKATSR